jgi:hypothetical protein
MAAPESTMATRSPRQARQLVGGFGVAVRQQRGTLNVYFPPADTDEGDELPAGKK